MTKNIISTETNLHIEKNDYPGGTNWVIENKVSVCETDDGLWDVQSKSGQTLYTGWSGEDAARAAVAEVKK